MIRDIRNMARRDLHQVMQVPAVYVGPQAAEVSIGVRIHTHSVQAGVDDSFDVGSRAEQAPRIVFLDDHLTAQRLGIFWISEAEAYQVEFVEPADGITRTAACVRLSGAKLESLTKPEIL